MGLIQVATATISSPDHLRSCVESLMVQAGLEPRDILLVCNSDRVEEECRAWEARGVRVYFPGTNLGTCASWNHACRQAWALDYNTCLLLNDDVRILDPEGVRRLAGDAYYNPFKLYFVHALGFSGVGITRHLWEEVGEFDEGFYPAYYEDNDYHRRAVLAGFGSTEVPMQTVHVGSGSLRQWREWEVWNAHWAFMTNCRRFVEKWGGLPENPQFDKPWNGHPERAWSSKDWLRHHAPPPPWGWKDASA